jgi:peptidoglycan/LPS O-acetylase OafA/YrhL
LYLDWHLVRFRLEVLVQWNLTGLWGKFQASDQIQAMELCLTPASTYPKHLPILEVLRAIAALSVCLFHFTNTSHPNFLPSQNIVREVGSFGKLGVEVFFVISGFLIPYSLYLRSYTLQDFTNFIIRRLKRLEPPYFFCIFLTILLSYLFSKIPAVKMKALSVEPLQILAHIAYLNAILKYKWVNPVFWTLAIEFQYYFFVALVFPLLNHENKRIRILGVLSTSVIGISIYSDENLLTHWLPLFAIGIVIFQKYVGHLKVSDFIFLLFILTPISIFIVGFQETIAGIFAGLVILFWGSRKIPSAFSPLSFAGTLSYSIYLLHIPVGEPFIRWGGQLPNSLFYRYPVLVGVVLLTIFSAYLLWRLIEKPSQDWAKMTRSPKASPVKVWGRGFRKRNDQREEESP